MPSQKLDIDIPSPENILAGLANFLPIFKPNGMLPHLTAVTRVGIISRLKPNIFILNYKYKQHYKVFKTIFLV